MSTKPREPLKAGQGHTIALEQLLWTCDCGTAMGLESFRANRLETLECRNCGPVAQVRVSLYPLDGHWVTAAVEVRKGKGRKA